MNLLRRLLPAKQTYACAGCGRTITERRRSACRHCGSVNRIVTRGFSFDLREQDVMR